jgi:lambda repressor-like predicted transcriptional regulator
MPARPRDPNDPDFPHGTAKGYWHGCRMGAPCPATPTCYAKYREYATDRRAKLKRGEVLRYRPEAIRAYVQTFLDRGWPMAAVARAAGLSIDGLALTMLAKRRSVLADTARRILAVDEDLLLEHAVGYVPMRLVRWKLGALVAIGWTCSALAARLGYHKDYLNDVIAGNVCTVKRDMVDDVDALFEQLRNVHRPSHPATRRLVARHGFQPPDAYAPDGLLWEDDIRNEKREERWARRDREALLHMQVARMAVKYNMSLGEIAKQLRLTTPAVEDHTIRRARKALGLAWDGGKAHGPKPGQEERIAQILDVVERWRQAGELADPHPFCVELGMMDARLWTSLDGKPKLEAA